MTEVPPALVKWRLKTEIELRYNREVYICPTCEFMD